jgi:hypothetical protein
MDSFPSASIELILLLYWFGASKMTFSHISTGEFLLFMIPMEPWVVLACSVDHRAIRVDKFVRDCSGKFGNFHSFSVAQSAGGLEIGSDHQDWVALPYNFAFYEFPLHPWQWCSSWPYARNMSGIGVQVDSFIHEFLDVLKDVVQAAPSDLSYHILSVTHLFYKIVANIFESRYILVLIRLVISLESKELTNSSWDNETAFWH